MRDVILSIKRLYSIPPIFLPLTPQFQTVLACFVRESERNFFLFCPTILRYDDSRKCSTNPLLRMTTLGIIFGGSGQLGPLYTPTGLETTTVRGDNDNDDDEMTKRQRVTRRTSVMFSCAAAASSFTARQSMRDEIYALGIAVKPASAMSVVPQSPTEQQRRFTHHF